MKFHVVTIFPELISSYMNESIMKRAQESKKITVEIYNPRNFADDKHSTVDDKVYGGGPGMVMKVEPVVAAATKAIGKKKKVKTIILSPGGTQFTNEYADNLLKEYEDVLLISGRYEGIDARVKEILKAEEVSVGPYTLTGGELPALIVMDTITRRIPGVLGKDESVEERRVASHDVYTRPEEFEHAGKTYKVPEVLLSGDHKEIENFRSQKQQKP